MEKRHSLLGAQNPIYCNEADKIFMPCQPNDEDRQGLAVTLFSVNGGSGWLIGLSEGCCVFFEPSGLCPWRKTDATQYDRDAEGYPVEEQVEEPISQRCGIWRCHAVLRIFTSL